MFETRVFVSRIVFFNFGGSLPCELVPIELKAGSGEAKKASKEGETSKAS